MAQLDIEYLTELDRVTVLLHPLRLQILELAIEGTSGTDAARRMGLPRQMVSYHVLALERAGFLVRIGEIRRRNMVERRVQSNARSYLISPEILGSLSGARRRSPDPGSRDGLLALAARVQSEVGPAAQDASASLPLLSFASKLSFADSASRTEFIRSLSDAVTTLLRTSTQRGSLSAEAGESYGFFLGFYPLPRSAPNMSEGDQR